MKCVAAALCCVLAAWVTAARASPFEHPLEREAQANAVSVQQRQLEDESSGLGLANFGTIGMLLQGLYVVGSQLLSSFAADGVGEDMARALEETDPIELALNTIDMDTMPCRRRLACELRSGISSYTFGEVAYEFISSHVPSLKKYDQMSARERSAPTCAAAYSCRYSNSPLMGTARSMRSLADGVCDMEGESISSILCRAFAFVVDSLETL